MESIIKPLEFYTIEMPVEQIDIIYAETKQTKKENKCPKSIIYEAMCSTGAPGR